MRAFKSVRRFFGLVPPAGHVEPSKPWPRTAVDQAFDNIVTGKIDDLTEELKKLDIGEVAKRTRAEVNKLTPEEKQHYLSIAHQQMAASAALNRPERKLGEMAYELRNLEHIFRTHPNVFGEPLRCVELGIALQEVRSAIIACDAARSWARDQWEKVNQPDAWQRYEDYKKECSDRACASTNDPVDPAVLSAIDQTP